MTEGTSSSSGSPEQTPSSQRPRSHQVNDPFPVLNLLSAAWPLFPGPCLSLLRYGSVTLCLERFSVPLRFLTFPSLEGILRAVSFLCPWSWLRAKHSLKLRWKRAVGACAEGALFWEAMMVVLRQVTWIWLLWRLPGWIIQQTLWNSLLCEGVGPVSPVTGAFQSICQFNTYKIWA